MPGVLRCPSRAGPVAGGHLSVVCLIVSPAPAAAARQREEPDHGQRHPSNEPTRPGSSTTSAACGTARSSPPSTVTAGSRPRLRHPVPERVPSGAVGRPGRRRPGRGAGRSSSSSTAPLLDHRRVGTKVAVREPVLREFNGILMRRIAVIDLGDVPGHGALTEVHVDRGAVFFYDAGRAGLRAGRPDRAGLRHAGPVHRRRPRDGRGRAGRVGDRRPARGLDLPVRVLERRTRGGYHDHVATVIQDEFENSYTLPTDRLARGPSPRRMPVGQSA